MLLLSLAIQGCSDPPRDETSSSPAVEVEVAPIRRATVRRYVRTLGTVEPAPAGFGRPAASAAVASPVEGVLAVARCSQGQRVARGETLFLLDTRTVDAAIVKAEVELDFARQTLARRRELIDFDGTSQQRLQDAEAQVESAEATLAELRIDRQLLEISAPLAGTVMSVSVRPGEAVRRDSILAEIVDLGRLVATMQVPAGQAASIHPDQVALVSGHRGVDNDAPALSAHVSLVAPGADRRTGTVSVRVALPAKSEWAPGELVDVQVITEERPDRLVVPVESLVTLGGATTIARVEGSMAVRSPVVVGLVDGDLAEIAGDGLQEGMTVVTVGSYGLPDATEVRVRPSDTER
jgi:membrane fusion protein (multidrug efflux system)